MITIDDIAGDNPSLPTVHILHGIHTEDGHQGPGLWAEYFTNVGFKVRIWDYGHVYALTARFWVNPKVVDKLFNEVMPGDLLLGHSNGCAIIADAVDEGLEIGGAILLNPALNVDRMIKAPFVYVLCNKDDMAVTAGKWWRRINPVSWIKRHPYGEQGRYGPDFTASWYTVFHGEEPPPGLPEISGHSDVNTLDVREDWGPYTVSHALDELLKIEKG